MNSFRVDIFVVYTEGEVFVDNDTEVGKLVGSEEIDIR